MSSDWWDWLTWWEWWRHKRVEGVQWMWNDTVVPVTEVRSDRRFIVASTQTLTSVGETATATVSWLDQFGQPFSPTGTTVSSSDTANAVATIAPAADGLSAQFTAVANGSLTVTFSANNNEGVAVTATGVLSVSIPVPPPADLTSGEVNWSTP